MRDSTILGCLVCVTLGLSVTAAPSGAAKDTPLLWHEPGPLGTKDENPFAGSRELSGLKILAVLLNSWDARIGNTGILRVPAHGGGVEASDERSVDCRHGMPSHGIEK